MVETSTNYLFGFHLLELTELLGEGGLKIHSPHNYYVYNFKYIFDFVFFDILAF